MLDFSHFYYDHQSTAHSIFLATSSIKCRYTFGVLSWLIIIYKKHKSKLNEFFAILIESKILGFYSFNLATVI